MKYISLDWKDIEIFSGIGLDLGGYYWIVESQAGYKQASDAGMPDDEWESLFSRGMVAIGESCQPTYVWRIGFFSDMIKMVNLDEWTKLAGFKCDPDLLDEAINCYTKIDWDTNQWIDFIERFSGFLAIFPDGWWEIATDDVNLLEKLAANFTHKISEDINKVRLGFHGFF